jgi:transcriptional regulator with XRE-family HTH domain
MKNSKEDKEQEILQEILREIRIKKQLKQSELADRLNLPQSFVSKYENGDRKLDIIELRKVCKALEIGLQKFVLEFETKLK